MRAWSSQTLVCSTPPALGSILKPDKVAVISTDTTADADHQGFLKHVLWDTYVHLIKAILPKKLG